MGFLSITEPILREMGNHNLSLLCLLNLSKAFDCVAHDSLLEKRRTFGISENWFKNYLTDRVQMVKVGRCGV